MATQVDPVKEAMMEARRKQILDAAAQVFAEKGFHQSTIKDVARAAGVADGTIYNYFGSKNDLVLALVMQLSEANALFATIAENAPFSTMEEMIQIILRNRLDLIQRNREMAQAILPQVISDPETRTLFYDSLLAPALESTEQVIQSFIDQGQIRDVAPAVVVRSLFSIIFGSIVLAIVGDSFMLDEPETFIDGITAFVLDGLRPHVDSSAVEG